MTSDDRIKSLMITAAVLGMQIPDMQVTPSERAQLFDYGYRLVGQLLRDMAPDRQEAFLRTLVMNLEPMQEWTEPQIRAEGRRRGII